jgi:N-acetylglucosamine-6-phosphate deacetylase
MQFYSATNIFNGHEWLHNKVVVAENGIVNSIMNKDDCEQSAIQHFDGALVPAFIDAQVYGAAGRLLAVYPQKETLHLMNETFQKEGTVLFMPTLATNTIEVFKQGIDSVRAYWSDGGKGVAGLHLEGPWLHTDKKGAHVKELIHAPDINEVRDLLDYGKGVIRMITLAPEVCSQEVIDLILSDDIIISAGHSNAKYYEAIESFDRGIGAVTHLYNAMSGLHHREPGLVGAAFQHEKVKASIIPDGYHVDYAAIAIAKKNMGPRLFAITDAVTETTTGPYQHLMAGDKYECNGVLSGSALSMHQAFLNLVQHVGIEMGEALRMCSLYPAQLLRRDNHYGRIAPGYAAQFLLLDHHSAISRVIT